MRGRSPGWVIASLAIIGTLSGCGGGALAGQSSSSTVGASTTAGVASAPTTVTQTVVITNTVTVTITVGGSSASSTSASASSLGVSSSTEAAASNTTTNALTTSAPAPHATPTSQPGGLPVAEASQVVLDFLGSLEKAPSGSASTQYLSQQLKAQVEGGRTIASLIGVQNIYRAYHADAAVSRGGGRAATVRTTLTYASGPVQRLFTLVPEGGTWKIDDIADSNA